MKATTCPNLFPTRPSARRIAIIGVDNRYAIGRLAWLKTIQLYGGAETLVDDSDFEWLSTFKWHNSHGYARTWLTLDGVRTSRTMHQLLMPRVAGKYTDHINRNKLDNRRVNLRLVTRSENNRNAGLPRHNTTGVKGVVKLSNNRWMAQIDFNERHYYIGVYATIELATAARVEFEDRLLHHPETIPPKSHLKRNNKTGITGVYQAKDRKGNPIWKVGVTENGNRKHLGTFHTLTEARQVREAYESNKLS